MNSSKSFTIRKERPHSMNFENLSQVIVPEIKFDDVNRLKTSVSNASKNKIENLNGNKKGMKKSWSSVS